MTDNKHTPGPWAVGYSAKACAVYMKPISEGWLVRDQVARFERSPEGEANARLIAAAPELLDLLIASREAMIVQMLLLGEDVEKSPFIQSIDAALAKAKGAP